MYILLIYWQNPSKLSAFLVLWISGLLCLVSMLIGLLFVLGSGSYWVDLFDSYGGSFPLITIALVESFGIGWVYGVDK